MKYLKKKNLYDLVKELSDISDMPKMKDCEYESFLGAEWLRFTTAFGHYVKVTCESGGKWLEIQETISEGGNKVIFLDVFAEGNPVDGYEYHSHHEKVVA